jgi:hypothetical protein
MVTLRNIGFFLAGVSVFPLCLAGLQVGDNIIELIYIDAPVYFMLGIGLAAIGVYLAVTKRERK